MYSDLLELFRLIYVILLKGGWVGFVVALVYMFYRLYMDYIHLRWYGTLEWVFLKITVPRENEKSPLAFEQIMNQLHSIHATRTLAETYLEGRFQIWFTWELTSIGGVIGNYVKILTKHRDTLEAAVYAQFPDAEITEAQDYFDRLPRYNVETSDYDIYAFSFILKKPDPYPIRTYHDFEHSTAETFVDPVEGVWEELGKLSPYEMFIVQFMFQPVSDEWKESGYHLVKKLKGEREALKPAEDKIGALVGKIIGPVLDVIIRPTPPTRSSSSEVAPISLMLHLSEGEKAVISAIERNLSKLGYRTKIRCFYLAPKEKYNPGPVYTAIVGSFKSVGASNLNSLKPDTDRWTKIRYWVNPRWERVILDLRLKWRKTHFNKWIRKRWFFGGPTPYVLNSEEIATILHFPQTTVSVPQIEKVTVTKVQPPPELPVAP